MRIAFGTNPAIGHVLPLLPLALAARDAGHDVAVVGGASITAIVEGHGLRHVVAGPPDLATVFQAIDIESVEPGPRRAVRMWSVGFADVLGRPLAHGLLDLARDWPPDLLIHEDSEQGTWIAAERLGIPHLALQATAWRGSILRLSRPPANAIRADLGLDEDPELASWHRYGFLTTRPVSLRDPDDPMPEPLIELRQVAIDGGESPDARGWQVPERVAGAPPRILATLGTVHGPRRTGLLATLVEGLEPVDAEIIVALGPGVDPADLGPRRDGVHLVEYVPFARLLATTDLVVSHAGSGTMLAALEAGRPMVLFPNAADQPQNAAACRAAGAALVIEPGDWSASLIRSTVDEALATPSLALAARRLAGEIAAMPGPHDVVRRLERIAGGDDAVRKE
jgi:hypothetical protein